MAKAIRTQASGRNHGRSFPDPGPLSFGDRHWKQLSDLGNAAFAREEWAKAERHYASAMAEAERIFAAMRDNAPVPGADAAPMLVVSVANAAENWLCSGQNARVGEALTALRRTLCEAIEDDELSRESREHCFTHLKHAVMELAEKLPRAGIAEDIVKQEVEAAKSVALRFINRSIPRH